MTATQKKTTPAKQESDEWISLFEEMETETQSLVYVKRMVVIAVSSITYLRGIFPEDSYSSRYLEDLCIKVLKQNCSCPGANKLVKWLMGCFDALEKRYLQIVLIGHVVESYQFKFRYTDQGPQMEILRNENMAVNVTMEDTKKASLLLIRKLFLLMQNLEALPNAVYLSMKLYYNDDVHFRVGDLQSLFHTMKVRVTAAQTRLGKLQDTSQLSEKRGVKGTNTLKAAGKLTNDFDIQDLPSENESAAQFKISKRTTAKVFCICR
ncbi:HORMA domain-containing protein 1 [Triplophysa tibetana]|uniref:HORMA domain-containing protein 1 n=1 Tax=Triplophysa tibetana TaxID=1572043 RepID=A0A5A9PB57_9TELE|nr:HORMA domain-containing protein 1 [Triplophysa tibetana]